MLGDDVLKVLVAVVKVVVLIVEDGNTNIIRSGY